MGICDTRRSFRQILCVLAVLPVLLCAGFPPATPAADLYLDNVKGNDSNPGSREQPFRSFAQALTVLRGGDTLHLTPNPEPYRERFGELGKKHSGTAQKPTVLDGHGARFTRLNPVAPDRWQNEGGDVYSLRMKHNIVVMSGKGYYDGFPFLFVDDKPLPCVKDRNSLTSNSCFLFLYYDPQLKKLHPDHGKLYVKLEPGKTPANHRILLPEPDGLIVTGDYIEVRNLHGQWSSADLFDTARGRGIVFENISATDCLDQCISAHSTAGCVVRASFFRNALAMCVLDVTFTPKEDCRMTYEGCIFEQGGAGFQGGGHYVVQNCIIRDNARSALMARGNAELFVRNCILVKGPNGRQGLDLSGSARVTLENCTLIGFQRGLCLTGKDARLTLKNCAILDSAEALFFWSGATPDQIVCEATVFSSAPAITIDKTTLRGLSPLRAQFPNALSGARELQSGEKSSAGCAIPDTLTLPALTEYLKSHP